MWLTIKGALIRSAKRGGEFLLAELIENGLLVSEIQLYASLVAVATLTISLGWIVAVIWHGISGYVNVLSIFGTLATIGAILLLALMYNLRRSRIDIFPIGEWEDPHPCPERNWPLAIHIALATALAGVSTNIMLAGCVTGRNWLMWGGVMITGAMAVSASINLTDYRRANRINVLYAGGVISAVFLLVWTIVGQNAGILTLVSP